MFTTLSEPGAAASKEVAETTAFGEFTEPANARAVIVFVHGSGSARHSAHDRVVSDYLNEHGFATVLLDVLTPREETIDIQSGDYRYNVELLAHRLLKASDKLANCFEPELPIVYFGIGTGAAAALLAASRGRGYLAGVICRSGLPDIAGPELASVRVPTLLIVGAEDAAGVASNQRAFDALQCERELLLVARNGHLLDKPGAMEEVAQNACKWLNRHLPQQAPARQLRSRAPVDIYEI